MHVYMYLKLLYTNISTHSLIYFITPPIFSDTVIFSSFILLITFRSSGLSHTSDRTRFPVSNLFVAAQLCFKKIIS